MEEDSAKMNHQGAESLSGSTHSLIDFNRAGTPLAEIVSEPDMRAGIEAAEYGRELQRVSEGGPTRVRSVCMAWLQGVRIPVLAGGAFLICCILLCFRVEFHTLYLIPCKWWSFVS